MQALFNRSQELSEVAKMMANELIKKANATSDPQERARLLALADEIKRAAVNVIAAAKNYAQVRLITLLGNSDADKRVESYSRKQGQTRRGSPRFAKCGRQGPWLRVHACWLCSVEDRTSSNSGECAT